MKPVVMKTGLTLFSVLTLFATPAAAASPSLFDLSLKGIVIEQNLAASHPNPSHLSLQGIVADDVLLAKPLAAHQTPVAHGSSPACMGS